LRFLFLAEGDPETRDSWSGISNSVVRELRARGHEVVGRNADLHGFARLAGIAATFSPRRTRWAARYHLGRLPFSLRSFVAGRHIRVHRDSIDVILQTGATFQPLRRHSIPYALYCDSNIKMAERGRASGQSEAVALSTHAIRAIAEREGNVYRGANWIFAISDVLRRSFIEDFGVPPERVQAVYAGPNFEVAASRTQPRSARVNAPTVLFVGRQFERKGGDLVLDAFARVREHLPTARLIIAGPKERVSADGVRWTGFLDKDRPDHRDQLISLYEQADVFCVPTRYEPFGVAFIEAMTFGLPCIGTHVGAVPEIIEHGSTGFLVAPDDAEELAERLHLLLANRGLARRMGSSGRERAERYFTWSAVIDKMLQSLEPVLVGNSR
jgi:glycosyltransferase involved in cell wall biosynthesis